MSNTAVISRGRASDTQRVYSTFSSPAWDDAPAMETEPLIMRLYAAQVRHACRRNEFWRQRLARWADHAVLTRRDVEAMPLLTKQELRLLDPYALVADPSLAFHLVRGTGGTTGAPVPMFWTENDWRAALEALMRWLGPLRDLSPLRAYNAYNQAHVSGPSFDDAIRSIGGTPIPRHFRASDARAVEDIVRYQVNTLVITPKGGSGKGGSLEDFLEVDPDFLAKAGVRALIVSSTLLDRELAAEVRAQGVAFIVNFYGSTEALPDAAACQHDATAFHLTQGPNLVEIIDPTTGRHVPSGGRGLVVASRIASASPDAIGPAEGSQILRLVVGDEATFVDEPCACGRRSPRIHDIGRVLDIEEKLLGGCERWE